MRQLISVLLIFFTLQNYAQQEAQFTQFFVVKNYYNPAFTAAGSECQTIVSARIQNLGVNGSPQTYMINYKMPFLNVRSAIGANLMYDNLGNFSDIKAKLNYAYNINFGNTALILGLSGGVLVSQLNDRWISSDSDVSDPIVPQSVNKAISPTFSVGGIFSGKSYYIALSSSNFIAQKSKYESQIQMYNRNHIYLLGSYTFDLRGNFQLIPSTAFSYDLKNYNLSVNLSSVYSDLVKFGLSYRLNESIGANLGFYIFENWFLSYSYDMVITKFSGKGNFGSHELHLSYNFYLKSNKKIKNFDNLKGVKNVRFL